MRIIKTIKNALICKYIPNFELLGSLRPYKHKHDFCSLQGRFDGNSTVLIHMGLNYASAKFTLCASLDNKLSARVRLESKTSATPLPPILFCLLHQLSRNKSTGNACKQASCALASRGRTKALLCISSHSNDHSAYLVTVKSIVVHNKAHIYQGRCLIATDWNWIKTENNIYRNYCRSSK